LVALEHIIGAAQTVKIKLMRDVRLIKMTNETLKRTSVPAIDAILGKKFPVLNDGFVRLVDYMGNDSAVVQAARVSYGDGTKKVSEDRNLIRYLMRHRHTTPFEMCELKIHVRVPMDCWRQWIRHRTASVNEYSTRYSEAINSCQTTDDDKWRIQGKGNKQGSSGVLPKSKGIGLSVREKQFHNSARSMYEKRLSLGVSREQARKDLPLSTYTEAYWKIDLKNLLHFLALRMDSHAQQEIRDYATVIGEEIAALWVPEVWSAFNDYHTMRNAVTLTAREIKVIAAMQEESSVLEDILDEFGWLNYSEKTGKLKRNRERSECEVKLKKLGLQNPW
jgi:thymidylate synthase (FAD)